MDAPLPPNEPANKLLKELDHRNTALRVAQTLLWLAIAIGVAIAVVSTINIQSQDKTLLVTANKNSKLRTQQLNELQSHFDCLFKYFQTPGRTGNTTLTIGPNQQECGININPTSSSAGATGATKSVSINDVKPTTTSLPSQPAASSVPMSQPAPLAASGSTPASNNGPSPAPVQSKPLLCRVTLGLLFCN